MKNNPYRVLGLGLVIGGAIFVPIAYFIIGAIPLTAVALSAIIIGFTSIALSSARSQISPEASQIILETGMENISALLEELGVSSKAIYFPASMRTGTAQALIPLSGDIDVKRIKTKIPRRLIVRWGDTPNDMAIAVTAPGGTGLSRLKLKSEPTPMEIEQAISDVLTGLLDLASSVEVHTSEGQLNIEIIGPRLHYENVWYYRCMGSPIASIAASIASDALGKPVRIKEESYNKGRSNVLLEVLG